MNIIYVSIVYRSQSVSNTSKSSSENTAEVYILEFRKTIYNITSFLSTVGSHHA
jgi:hypothetical protein